LANFEDTRVFEILSFLGEFHQNSFKHVYVPSHASLFKDNNVRRNVTVALCGECDAGRSVKTKECKEFLRCE